MGVAESFEGPLEPYYLPNGDADELQAQLDAMLDQGPELSSVAREFAVQLANMSFVAGRKYQAEEYTVSVDLNMRALVMLVEGLQ